MNPYISFVVVGRNDNYGEGFLDRFQRFLDNLERLCEKHSLDSELLVVEWNPPEREKRLYEALHVRKSVYLKKRFIEVSKKWHDKVAKNSTIPLLEYFGKNVGIRRAKGEFIVCTNADIIFSDEIIEFFSRRKLDIDAIYRSFRYNLDKDNLSNISLKDLNSYCRVNYIHFLGIPMNNYDHSSRLSWFKEIFLTLRWQMRKIYLYLINKKIYRLEVICGEGAPGDFLLLSKQAWIQDGGFPEIPGVQGYSDTYFLLNSRLKCRKIVLLKKPQVIYHQYHSTRAGSSVDDYRNIFLKNVRAMIYQQRPMRFNGGNWGLVSAKLNEKHL